jgi:hypothetical protein
MPNETTRFRKPEEYAEPARLPVTSEGWREIRQELSDAITSEEAELEKIAAQIEEQSLKAVVGDVSAQRQVQELRRQQLERELNVRLKRDALRPTQHALKVAEQREAEAQEAARKREFEAHLEASLVHAQATDAALEALVESERSRHDELTHANAVARTEDERVRVKQLENRNAATWAAGKVRLHDYLDFGKGSPVAYDSQFHTPAEFTRVRLANWGLSADVPEPPPQRKKDEIVYQTEADALSQARPRS